VAQLNQIQAKLAFDFAQHFIPGIVTTGVPTGGK
jgi:hypothetical protein